jgi:hypothetical protein
LFKLSKSFFGKVIAVKVEQNRLLAAAWSNSPSKLLTPCACLIQSVRQHSVPIFFLAVGYQGWPLGGASGALAPGADFEGAPKKLSPTGHTLIRSTVAW